MYVNYVNDRKQLGYKVVKDTNCGIELVLITKSTVPLVRNLSLNLNSKTKREIVVITLASVFWFSNLESIQAMGLSVPPTPVVKLEPNYKHIDEIKVAPTVSPKLDKITFMKYRELPICIYMMDERFLKTSEISKLIKKLRGGTLIETAGFLILIVVLWQIMGVGIEAFQFPIVHPNGAIHRPANGGIQQHMNHPKHGGRITVRMSESNKCRADQTQVSSFVKDGKGVYGPDFQLIGQGAYSHVTHVEVKNPVGSDIEKASRNGYSDIVKQGNKIGNKLSKQQSKWSTNDTFRASLSNIDPNAPFPQSPANTLGLVDEFDVPISEKMIVQNAVENNCTNTSNVIFINNETNI